jgi:predicted ATPase with chaperone activity
MSDKVNSFCDGVHEKLENLDGRMDSLKLNVGSTWQSLQEKLDEVRCKGESTKQAVTVARTDLEQWVQEKKAETKEMIDAWVENRETQKLAARAQKAEDCAAIAIQIAQASIDDAERMALEAIAARRDAEAVIVGH